MGSSLLKFQSVGGHGCNREAKVGEEVVGCGRMGCPDCEARRAVETLLRAGVGSFEAASFTHWPGDEDGGVVDVFELVNAEGEVVPGAYINAPGIRLRVVRRNRDFLGNTEAK